MEMQVSNARLRIGSNVHHEPVPARLGVITSRFSHLPRRSHHLDQHLRVGGFEMSSIGDMANRYDLDVEWGLRVEIVERDDRVGAVDDLRWDLTSDD